MDRNRRTRILDEAKGRLSCLFSPMLHTQMLYWACYFKLDMVIVNDILNNTSAYPEGPIGFLESRTPIHAAAQKGNREALITILNNVEHRYERARRKRDLLLFNFDERFASFLKTGKQYKRFQDDY